MCRPVSVLLLAVATCAFAAATAAARPRETVNRTLAQLAARGSYDAAEMARWKADWRTARHAVQQLRGDERRNLAGVIADTRSLASRRQLSARARPAFETLRRNLEWFVKRGAPGPATGARNGFGTDVVSQLFDGSGWELQPLGSLGALNALLKRRRTDARVRVLADQLLRLGVWRKGFLAFETHVQRILSKLGVRDRVQAVILAHRHGFVDR